MTLEACSTLPFFKAPLWVSVSIPAPSQRIGAAFVFRGVLASFPRGGGRLSALKRLLEVLRI
jgi:hypothetical protein